MITHEDITTKIEVHRSSIEKIREQFDDCQRLMQELDVAYQKEIGSIVALSELIPSEEENT